jgi:hypothetical protein
MIRARLAAAALVGAAVLGAASSASATVRIGPLLPLTKIRADSVTSKNWSGYAVQSASKFTDVTGSWVQPAATCPSTTKQYAAFWAGIDGYASNSVEQLGTDSDCAGAGKPSYYAWWEMYPAASVQLSATQYPVKPGDALSAEVSVSGTNFTLSLLSSEGWRFSTVQSGSGLSQASAEVIAESPDICVLIFCHIAQLANFGTVNVSNAQAAVNGGADQPFSAFTADSGPHEITAVTNTGAVKAQPSPLSATGNAFSITWKHT